MFRGCHALNLDAKGRLAIPSKLRQRLHELCSGQLVMTLDHSDPCLLVFPLPVWEEIEEQVSRLPVLDEKVRVIRRMMLGYASECELDGHGRVLVPTKLRGRVSIDKHVALVGQGKRLELWNEQLWSEHTDAWLSSNKHGEGPLSSYLETLSF